MKKILIVWLCLISLTLGAQAQEVSPLENLRLDIDNLLTSSPSAKTFEDVKKLADENNKDIDVALENYIIAKKNVSVARAQYNPVTTGHLLGISLGLTYLWAPLAVEAVLSLPTKYYNVSKNKYISYAQANNVNEARNVLKNEVGHLYFDTLTHEMILRSIDLEVEILTYQEARWTEKEFSKARINDLKKWLLRLNIERANIYSLYVEEVAVLKTLISTSSLTDLEISHIKTQVKKEWITFQDVDQLATKALATSPKYKAAKNLESASHQNVKSIKWSIIAPSGMNFGYKRRVQEAKNEVNIAALRTQSVALGVKNNVSLKLQSVASNMDVFDNYYSVSEGSLDIFSDSLEMMKLGVINEDAVIETALTAIRDYRSRVVAHYALWSSYDDFNLANNYKLEIAAKVGELEKEIIVGEVTETQETTLSSTDFNVSVSVESNHVVLTVDSAYLDQVHEIDYIFSSKRLENKSSQKMSNNFRVSQSSVFMPNNVHGVALVTLKDGKELRVKF